MPCNEADIKSKFLTIRWSDGTGGSPVDDGTRPLPDPTAYWESPDLWLSGGIDKATAKVGVPNQVWARVFNFGAQPVTGINVEVWICDFTMGVSPASSLPSSNPGHGAMTGYYPGTVNPGSSADIHVIGAPMPCPPGPPAGPTTTDWCPTGTDAGTNGGHVCMAGNCYGDNNDSGASFTGPDMKFLCNCHHGQHNIAVVAVPMGQMHIFHFRMFAANPEPRRVLETVVTMRRVEIGKDFDPKLRRLLLESPHALAGVTAEAVNLAPDLGGAALRPATVPPALIGFRRPGGVVDPAAPLKLTLRPHQQELIEAHVQFQPHERPGSVHAFDLVEQETTGAIVGGARLITILTP